MKKILEISRETRLSQVTGMQQGCLYDHLDNNDDDADDPDNADNNDNDEKDDDVDNAIDDGEDDDDGDEDDDDLRATGRSPGLLLRCRSYLELITLHFFDSHASY